MRGWSWRWLFRNIQQLKAKRRVLEADPKVLEKKQITWIFGAIRSWRWKAVESRDGCSFVKWKAYIWHWELETHSTENLKYIQKWNYAASFPISTFMYKGAIYIFPGSVLFGISVFLYCVRELSAQLKQRREGQGTAAKQWLAAAPCPPLCSCGLAESSHKRPNTNFQFGKLRIINGNN